MTTMDAINEDILSLPSDISVAREYALLGAYDVSIQYYERGTKSIDKFLRLLADTSERPKWAQLKQDILAEIKLVKELSKECASFRQPPGSSAREGAAGRGRGGDGMGQHATDGGVAFTAGGFEGDGQSSHRRGGGGVRAEMGQWSPPVPRDKSAGSGGAAPWEGRPLASNGAAVGASRGQGQGQGAGSRGTGAPGKRQPSTGPTSRPPAQPSSGPTGRATSGGAGGGGVGGAVTSGKAIIKAPLPPEAKRTAASGPAAGPGRHGGPSRPEVGNAVVPGVGGSGAGAGAGAGAGGEKPRYSEANRGAVDFDLIERLEREVLDLEPNTRWGDIAGLEEAKGVLQEAVVLPLMCPGFFSGIRRPWRGVLLYGPPGTGKTLLAKAVATECKTTFINVSASSLASKWRGDSEKLVRILFDMARYYAPAVVFIDEVDSVATRRSEGEHEASRRMKTEMLIAMDGIAASNGDVGQGKDSNGSGGGAGEGEGGQGQGQGVESSSSQAAKMVMVLGATNQPWELDDAFKRRFEKRIYIPLPGPAERVALFRIALRELSLDPLVDLEALAKATENYSGADVTVVAKHAAYAPMRRLQADVAKQFPRSDQVGARIAAIQAAEATVAHAPITQEDLLLAIQANKPSASNEGLKRFEEYAHDHGSAM